MKFKTINRTKVRTFSPNLIKIRPLDISRKNEADRHTDRQINTHTEIKFVGATVHRL